MIRKISTILVCVVFAMHLNAQNEISGRVVNDDLETLSGASVYLVDLRVGATTDFSGRFTIKNIPDGSYELKISYIGYDDYVRSFRLDKNLELNDILLKRSSYLGQEATISAFKAGENTPMAFVTMDKEEISAKNYGQDVPMLLENTPSLITTSDAGHGIGYTAMRIRGTDANRINVTVNGIPLNDAESQSVFWVDLPEIAASADEIQIQRGVGTSTNGAAAFGATVNLQTNTLNETPYADYRITAGSFNTLRNSISLGSGLIKDRFTFDMRLSDLHSDGYIDRSWTDLQSYYLSAGYSGETSSIKFITFGGFEELYQSWGGVPSNLLKTDRTFNAMGAYQDTSGQTVYYENQVDHYDQIHYQLHFSKKMQNNWQLNSALHYTKGKGYYEQYESDQDYSFYSMQIPVVGTDSIYTSDLVRRKWLSNDFYGAIASLSYKYEKGDAILGGGWNTYNGKHYGKVIWAEYFGENSIGHQWYEGLGDKIDWNIYGKYYHYLNRNITTFVDLQLRAVNHEIDGSDANNRNVVQNHSFLFFNPKAGILYRINDRQRAFFSYARANREPNRNNYTDAPLNNMPVPETLNDFEAGYSYSENFKKVAITLYYMDYMQQLVLTGQINEVGYPIMTNVDESYRMGIEIEAGYNFFDKIIWSGNISLSRNKIKDFVNYMDNWDYWSDPVNEPLQIEEQIGNSTLAFSPSIVASNQIDYLPVPDFKFSLLSKYVGSQYIDNSSSNEYTLNAYLNNDLKATYTIKTKLLKQMTLSVLVRNVLNHKYETNAWIYRYYSEGKEAVLDGYFPQAGRHLMFSLGVRF